MAMQQFCLRWNNHQPNFISVFTTLLNNESLVDVTLAAEGRHLQAHKVVLSACSSYFQALFTVNPCQHPIVILKDVKYSDLKIIVDFMYYGEVNISQEQLSAILKTAEMLKVKGLADMGGDNIGKSQSVSSDKVELLTPGDSTWDSARQTPSPLSASAKRKRLRKSSTGSGSGSTERTSEEQLSGEITLVPSPTLVKSEPVVYATTPATDGDSGRSDSSLRNSAQEPSTDSEPREGSQDSVEEDPLGIHISQDSTTCVDNPIPDTGPGPSTSHHQQTLPASHGLQWNLLEHGFHHQNIMPPSCLYAPSSPYLNSCLPNPMTPARRRRGTNPQAEENFIRALDAVRFGGLGFCKAARIFGVNNRTLWLEYRKRGYPILRPSIRVRKQEPPDSQLQEMQQLPPTSPLGVLEQGNELTMPQTSVLRHRFSDMMGQHVINFQSLDYSTV